MPASRPIRLKKTFRPGQPMLIGDAPKTEAMTEYVLSVRTRGKLWVPSTTQPDPDPVDPTQPAVVDPVNPGSSGGYARFSDDELWEIIGGKPGSGNRKVIEKYPDKVLTEKDLEANTDYYGVTFTQPTRFGAMGRKRNVRFINCTWKGFKSTLGVHGGLILYANGGHKPWNTGFVFANCNAEDLESQVFCEFKMYGAMHIGWRAKNVKYSKLGRLRIGDWNLFYDWQGFRSDEFTVRCENNYIGGVDGAEVVLSSGNLPHSFKDWIEDHEQGTKENMEACGNCYIGGVSSVMIGKPSDPGLDNKYPAFCNIIDPAQKNVQVFNGKGVKVPEKGTVRRYVDVHDWLQARNKAVAAYK